jgi:hypothetical protein
MDTSKIQLTQKAATAVAKIRARLPQVKAEYGINALQQINYEFANQPLAVIEYALNRATPDDIGDLVKYGLAKWV